METRDQVIWHGPPSRHQTTRESRKVAFSLTYLHAHTSRGREVSLQFLTRKEEVLSDTISWRMYERCMLSQWHSNVTELIWRSLHPLRIEVWLTTWKQFDQCQNLTWNSSSLSQHYLCVNFHFRTRNSQSPIPLPDMWSRPNISQFCCQRIRQSTFLNNMKFAELRILRLWKCSYNPTDPFTISAKFMQISETSIDGFWSSKIVKGSVGKSYSPLLYVRQRDSLIDTTWRRLRYQTTVAPAPICL